MTSNLMRHWAVRWLVAPVAILWALGYGWYQLNYPTCTFRYKITAEVETPDGLKSGSSVVEVNYQRGGDWGGGAHGEPRAVGEAVYIDLGHDKNLFITLSRKMSGRDDPRARSDNEYTSSNGAANIFSLPLKAWALAWQFGKEPQLCADLEAASAVGKKIISHDNLPTLVTYSNLGDPTSMKVVQPGTLADALGDGYELGNVTIEKSDETPTQTLNQVLPWLPDHLSSGKANPFKVGPFWYDQLKQPGIFAGGII